MRILRRTELINTLFSHLHFKYLPMRTLLFYTLLFLVLPIQSQSYDKHLKTNITSEGILYYIYNFKMKSKSEGAKSLEYDFTHLNERDHVTLTATCITTDIANIDSFYLSLPTGEKFECGVEKIYTEHKSKWRTRFRVNFSYDLWQEMYGQNVPFRIILLCKDKKQIIFEDSAKAWKKNRKKLSQIQEVIEVNKN